MFGVERCTESYRPEDVTPLSRLRAAIEGNTIQCYKGGRLDHPGNHQPCPPNDELECGSEAAAVLPAFQGGSFADALQDASHILRC